MKATVDTYHPHNEDAFAAGYAYYKQFCQVHSRRPIPSEMKRHFEGLGHTVTRTTLRRWMGVYFETYTQYVASANLRAREILDNRVMDRHDPKAPAPKQRSILARFLGAFRSR